MSFSILPALLPALTRKAPVFLRDGALFCFVRGSALDGVVQNLEDDQIVLAVQCANMTLVTSRLPHRHIPALLYLLQDHENRGIQAPTHPEWVEFRAWQSRHNARILRSKGLSVPIDGRQPASFKTEPVTIADVRDLLKHGRFWNNAIVDQIKILPNDTNLRLLAEALEKVSNNDEQEFIAEDAEDVIRKLRIAEGKVFGRFGAEEVSGVVRQIVARYERRSVPSSRPTPGKYLATGGHSRYM